MDVCMGVCRDMGMGTWRPVCAVWRGSQVECRVRCTSGAWRAAGAMQRETSSMARFMWRCTWRFMRRCRSNILDGEIAHLHSVQRRDVEGAVVRREALQRMVGREQRWHVRGEFQVGDLAHRA